MMKLALPNVPNVHSNIVEIYEDEIKIYTYTYHSQKNALKITNIKKIHDMRQLHTSNQSTNKVIE